MGPDCCEPGAFGDVRGSCSARLRLLQKKQDSTLPGKLNEMTSKCSTIGVDFDG
jgi:hypothetical protein